jgi:multimeric flavodoxin WrbA
MTHVLGVFGSPRRGGNTDRLLEEFLSGAAEGGARCTRVIAAEADIKPCTGCQHCEIERRCVIEDGMQRVYALIEDADVVVLASPIYFYGLTAQAKALVDRCQVFWARKHRFGERATKPRAGFLISVGGSAGPRLFECAEMTMKYFCEALDAEYVGSLTFRSIDLPGDIDRHPEYLEETRHSGRRIADER